MSDCIEVGMTFEVSGYARGHQSGVAFYDAVTGEFIDWELTGDFIAVRNDMEVDTSNVPLKIEIGETI